MKLLGNKLYITDGDRQHIQQNLITYIRNARTNANNYNPGAPAGAVVSAFGNLNAGQKADLVAKCDRIIQALDNCNVAGRVCERDVQLAHSSGTDLHNAGQVGAAYAFGVGNVNKHFTLRVYVGMTFRNASREDKYHLIVHELSHRILGAQDVENAVCGGVDGTKCYLRANVTALAGVDCDEALNNADSWGYFVDESNALVTTIY